MKKIILAALICANGAYAATPTTSGELKTKKKTNLLKDFGLTIELGSSSVRDDELKVSGSSSYIQIEPSYKINKKLKVSTGAQYNIREASGEDLGDSEADNRDHLGNVFGKILYKAASYRDNGIADLRLQGRVYSEQDDFFKKRYGTDGDYQARVYFGRPITGNWGISKYTSYLRYKNYFNNDNVNDRSRDYELRAKVTPTYRAAKGLDLGLGAEYNHIFGVNKTRDVENVELNVSTRYQYQNYSALFVVTSEYMNNNGGRTALTQNSEANEDLEFLLVLQASL